MSYSRRKFLGTALTAGATGLLVNTAAPSASAAAPDLLVLENNHWLVSIDRATGCVSKLESKDQAWKLQGVGMRLHVPAPEHPEPVSWHGKLELAPGSVAVLLEG